MREIVLKGVGEKVYYDQCDNGLKIYVWVNEKVNTFKGSLVFLGGAENTEFTVNSKKYSVPSGTAHYLEHIMCKNDDGSSLLGNFNQLNSYSNAATYADKTAYEFVGTTNILGNLELLLDSIQTKNFVLDCIETERGPILEEARMQEDNGDRLAYYGINSCLFFHYPNRVSGVGTTSDIERISLQDLKLFYEFFYHPLNSFLVVTGNVNPLEVIHFVKENQKKKKFPVWKKPCFPKYVEPKKIVCEHKEIQANVELPKVYVSVKVPISSLPKKNIVTLLSILQLVLISNFGSTSLFREEMIEKKLVLTLNTSVEWERKYFVLKVWAKTKYPLEVLPILKEKLKNLDVYENDIFRKIKSEIANLVLGYEDPEYVNDIFAYMIVKYGKILTNEKEILEGITIKDILDVVQKIPMDKMNTFVVNPLKKGD